MRWPWPSWPCSIQIHLTDNSAGRRTYAHCPRHESYITSLIGARMYNMFPETEGRWVRVDAIHLSRVVVGHAELQILPVFGGRHVAFISTVALLPPARGLGIGGKLVGALIGWLERNGHSKVRLHNTGGEISFRCYSRAFMKRGWLVAYAACCEAPVRYGAGACVTDYDVLMTFWRPTAHRSACAST